MFSFGTYTLVIVLLGATGAFPFVITAPSSAEAESAFKITWTPSSGDPTAFSIALAQTQSNFAVSVATQVNADGRAITITLPQVNPGQYILQFVNVEDINQVLASSDIEIGDGNGSNPPPPPEPTTQNESTSTPSIPNTSSTTTSSTNTTTPTPTASIPPPATSTPSFITGAITSQSQSGIPIGTQSAASNPKKTLAAGAIVGIMFGASAALILGIFVVFHAARVRRKREASADLDPEPSTAGTRDTADDEKSQFSLREDLAWQLRAVQRQLEELQGAVGHSSNQNEILQARIRMLEGELQYQESQGSSDQPPPGYME